MRRGEREDAGSGERGERRKRERQHVENVGSVRSLVALERVDGRFQFVRKGGVSVWRRGRS